MQKEGKMLINKEQNQVYPQNKRHTLRPTAHLFLTMNNFYPLLNR